MASIRIEGLPEAAPEAEPWPVDDHPIGIQADEMFARQLDNEFSGELRTLLYHPDTGLAAMSGEDALHGVANAMPMLGDLRERILAQAIGPRQRAILEPLLDTRLDLATSAIGTIAQRATTELDDQTVAERIAGLQQDAAQVWPDPAQLRKLGRAAVGELRYQGERRGWDESQTDTTVRRGLSDLYAGAVEEAIGQDPDRAAKLYEHAREVIQPERQQILDRKIERAREERGVTEIVGSLADTPDDPTRRPDLDDYQVRAAELTPQDASTEARAQVNRMARLEHARADRAWQAARGRAAVAALDWMTKNPAEPLLAMPPELRDGLSPEQTERLDAAAINGGRVVSDSEVYELLDQQAVYEPKAFVGLDLSQYRLSLDDQNFQRLIGFQNFLAEGKSDAAFERHGLGRMYFDEGLGKANLNPGGPEGRAARRQFDRLLSAFEDVEGKPPTMADIRSIVGEVVHPLANDPNVIRVGAGDPAGADGNTQVAQQQEPAEARPGVPSNVGPAPGSPEHEAPRRLTPIKKITGPISGLDHYMAGSGDTVEYDFKEINTSAVKPAQFPRVKEILSQGQPGRYEIEGRMPFSAPGDAHYVVGNITLNIRGTLELDEKGRYSFKGELGAEPDRYRFYRSDHRRTDAEIATHIGTWLPGSEFSVVIAGTKPIDGEGDYR